MGRCFSDSVEQALQYIYYDMRSGKGMEGLQLLERASAAGDGDASCFLARCLCGPGYVWDGHHFPVDDRRATKLYHESVKQGSALGVLICLRSGELTPSVEASMPFADLQEAFDKVLACAKAGDAFCQYTIANSYFWWDFLRIQKKGENSFSNRAEYKAYLKENISQCEEWFWKALRGGIYFAANNLDRYYRQGDEDIILPQPEKARDLYKIGAETGNPYLQYFYGEQLEKAGDKAGAFYWYQQALEGGEPLAWYDVGHAYDQGKLVPQNLDYAVHCFERGMAEPRDSGSKIGCANTLGEMCFNGRGVARDYVKAFQLFNYAYAHKSNWGVLYLAKCYFYGLGTQQDYVKARQFLEMVGKKNEEVFFMLGFIHARGLGVPEDIKKGMEYLQKAGDYNEAMQERLRYKKTLFGKWVRR